MRDILDKLDSFFFYRNLNVFLTLSVAPLAFYIYVLHTGCVNLTAENVNLWRNIWTMDKKQTQETMNLFEGSPSTKIL